ncbi:hypothetical protein Tco_0369843 [Tanacetum coccineum]
MSPQKFHDELHLQLYKNTRSWSIVNRLQGFTTAIGNNAVTEGLGNLLTRGRPAPGFSTAIGNNAVTEDLGNLPTGGRPAPGFTTAIGNNAVTEGLGNLPTGGRPAPGFTTAIGNYSVTEGLGNLLTGGRPAPSETIWDALLLLKALGHYLTYPCGRPAQFYYSQLLTDSFQGYSEDKNSVDPMKDLRIVPFPIPDEIAQSKDKDVK